MKIKSYKDYNDYELVYLIGEQDELSYDILHTKYHPVISKMAKKYLEYNKNIGLEYEDLYQEGVCGLENALSDYNENTSLFYTYAVLCIKREMERMIKTYRRHKHSLLNEAYSINDSINDIGDIMLEDTLYQESSVTENIFISEYYCELIRVFKYELSDIDSSILELRMNGFSSKEIGVLLDMSRKNVDSHLRQIRKALKKYQNKVEQ